MTPHSNSRGLVESARPILCIVWGVVLGLAPVVRANESLPDDDTLKRAMVAELERSMAELKIDDLPTPYFLQYRGEDRLGFNIVASYGGLLSSNVERSRQITSRVRVGSFELDNSNIGQVFGMRTALPIDDDELALRHAIWRMTDTDYKRAVEILTRKQAYLKQKNIIDRPDNFTPSKPVTVIEPSARLDFDMDYWQDQLTTLTARLKNYPSIQDGGATLFAGVVNEWMVNSEGTRLRTADSGVYVQLFAETQAKDGMWIGHQRGYLGLKISDLPKPEEMLSDIDELAQSLIELSNATPLEHYTGPVLFEPVAAGMVFEVLLAEGLGARPIPLGSGWEDTSLEKKIGSRILPRSFQVYDDATAPRYQGKVLAGAFTFDDQGVAPKKVVLVENGMLKTLLASRSPTRKIKETTGHGRGAAYGDPTATIGCLFISDDKAVSPDELKRALIEAARDEDLEFALRIKSMQAGGYGELGDPVFAYKVYVEDGREELVRGLEFLPVETRSLKRILAAGGKPKVYNSTSGVPASIIAPAILFEELELTKTEEEFDKPPILKSPAQRE